MFTRTVALVASSFVLLVTVAAPGVVAQESVNPADVSSEPPLTQEELDQLLAPIALYPDPLLSQIFMASTYPIEVVQADRWVQAHPDLTGDALATELEKESWDPSVKSLVNFPDVLAMMSERLDWTVKLGDAFIADETSVMDTVQTLRSKALAAGNLKDSNEQKIVVQQAPAAPATQIIQIEPADPQVIYVPVYDPVVVYGPWWYPAYRPYFWHPRRFVVGSGFFFSIGFGFPLGPAWGYAWGGCDWHRHRVDIDIHRHVTINRYINRTRYETHFRRNPDFRDGRGPWQHNPRHRVGVAYRDRATARRYGGVSWDSARRAREAFRGRAEQGRRDLARGGGAGAQPGRGGRAGAEPGRGGGAGAQPGRGGGAGAQPGRGGGAGAQPGRGGGAGARPGRGEPAAGGRSDSTGTRSGAFDGVKRGGSEARNASQRGRASRSGGGSRGGGGHKR